MQDLIDRLPPPLGALLFGADLLVEGSCLFGVILGAGIVIQAYVLAEKIRAVLQGLIGFFQWLLELPGTGEEVRA